MRPQSIRPTPSTHILKPEIAVYPKTVENEAFCMRLAKELGLDVASVETIGAASWGISRERATATLADILQRVPAAMAAAREQTPGLPEEMFSTIENHLDQLL